MKSRDGTAKLFAQRLDMPYEDLKAKAGPDSTLLKLLLSLEEEGLVTESTSSKCAFTADIFYVIPENYT